MRAVLSVVTIFFIGCVGDSNLGARREAVVEADPIYISLDPPPGETTSERKERLIGVMVKAQVGPGQGSLVTRCFDDFLCNAVTVALTRPPGDGISDAGVRIQGTWQLTGPRTQDGLQWRGEFLVRADTSGGDVVATKVENLESLIGQTSNNSASMLPASEVTCQIPPGCNPDLAPPPAPEGGTWICVPICRPCVPSSDKVCL